MMDRREFFEGAAVASAAAVLLAAGEAQAQSTGAAKTYQPKPLPVDAAKIPGMSENLINSHYQNNYIGAVNRLNAIGTQLAALDFSTAPGFLINGLKREELMAYNSMVMHELYFSVLGGGGAPGGALADALARDFGSVERWHAEFSAMGKAQGGGSGWTILSYSPRDKRLMNSWAADHTTQPGGGRPVLALDMYEHSYHMDYGAKAAAYVDAFMGQIRWQAVADQFDRVSREA